MHLAKRLRHWREKRSRRTAERDPDEAAFAAFKARHAERAHGQLQQDLWALFETSEKREGYFVEFGACDGRLFSNTYLLESAYGWTGALAEPARSWHEALRRNRACRIVEKCVWKESGARLTFNEAADADLSTIEAYTGGDSHAAARSDGSRYEVETISLLDLLRQCGAPRTIDYLSLDTEGSEYEILRAFDFSAYDVRLISVEHNYAPRRADLCALLLSRGYRRRFPQHSAFDDWYVKR